MDMLIDAVITIIDKSHTVIMVNNISTKASTLIDYWLTTTALM